MNYAEANYKPCPHCGKRGLPKEDEGVTAVACIHCKAVVEINTPKTVIEIVCYHCGNARELLGKRKGKVIEYLCTNCGSVYQVYIGPPAVYQGTRTWNKAKQCWESPRVTREGPSGDPGATAKGKGPLPPYLGNGPSGDHSG